MILLIKLFHKNNSLSFFKVFKLTKLANVVLVLNYVCTLSKKNKYKAHLQCEKLRNLNFYNS